MRKMQVGTGVVMVHGERCHYDVINANFEPRLPNFVGAVDATRGTYFISEDVPEEYRPIMIAHEHRCAHHAAAGQVGCCEHALKEELVFAVERGVNLPAYIGFRLGCFDALLAFYAKSPNKRFVQELTRSRDHLRMLAS